MIRYISLSIVLALGLGLMACHSKDEAPLSLAPTPTELPALADTPTPVTVKLVTPSSATPTPTPTPTATFTPSATPTPTPTPTNTPVPSKRRETAHRAFHNGDYVRAKEDFDALLADPGASDDEQRQALYWRGRSELTLKQYNAAANTFDLFLAQYPDDELTRPVQFNQALALERRGLYTETIAAYQASLLPDDPIAVYIYERMGDLSLAFEDFEAAEEWYRAGLDVANDTGFQVHLREGIAEAYLGQEKFDEAFAQYSAILEAAKIPAYRAKINRLIGEAYLQADDTEAAQAQFQETLDRYPETFDAYLSLVNMVDAGMDVDEFQRGYIDYHGGDAYQPAIEAMGRFLATEADRDADEAHWISAWSQRALGNYNEAIADFDQIIAHYPDSHLWPDAHIQKARILGWQGEVSQAVKTYRDFAAENPEHPLSREALYKAALIEFQDDQFENAYQHFRDFAARYPHSDYSDDARHWAGLAAFQQGHYADAEAEWAALLSNYPAGEFGRQASYWQAKTLQLMGETDEAERLLRQLANQPFNYYSLRAGDLLNDHRLAPTVPLDLYPSTPAEQVEAETWLAHWLGLSQSVNFASLDRRIEGNPAFTRAEALFSLGLREDALNEYETVMDNWRDNPLAMYQLALIFRERGAYRLSILSALELVKLSPATDPADVPNFIRRLIYPTYYQDLILPQAEALDLDPALVFALIRQESLYDPNARSFADARGLMQIIPTTGADIANRTFTENYSDDDLWLPTLNVEFGTWYIKKMLDFLDGNQVAALAAYNAGPGRVQRWITYPGAEDLDVFAALIPLSEPREYIRRIYLNLAAYREIYAE